MRRSRLFISGLAILLLLMGSIVVFMLVRSYQNASHLAGMTIRSVSMTSPSEGWAVGAISGSSSTLLLHYTAGHWRVVAPPADLNAMADLSAVAMVSRDEGWAVGQVPAPTASPNPYRSYREGGLLLHYHGGKWAIAAAPQREYLSGVSARSATDVWAVGYGLVLHYDGKRWAEVAVPPALKAFLFTAVSLPPDGSVWIAGGNVVLHYDGHAWQWQKIPVVDGNALNITDLAMSSAAAGWAVGTIYNSPRGVILRDADGRWVVEQETDAGLTAISISSNDEGWAVGGRSIMHYSHGRWSAPSVGTRDLLDVAITSSSDAWAVGPDEVLRFHNGSWQNDSDVQWEQDALRHYQGR